MKSGTSWKGNAWIPGKKLCDRHVAQPGQGLCLIQLVAWKALLTNSARDASTSHSWHCLHLQRACFLRLMEVSDIIVCDVKRFRHLAVQLWSWQILPKYQQQTCLL